MIRPYHVSHYTRALVARRGRPACRQELEAMAAWIEGQWPKVVRFLPPEMLARLELIEAQPREDVIAAVASTAEPGESPPPRSSEVRAVPTIDQWATAAHQWQCGCTQPSAGECSRCAGSCLCHVGAAVTTASERREAV